MTKLLEEAFAEASKFSEEEQNALAYLIFEELSSERRWQRQFAESEDALAKLAREAIAEYNAGRTAPLDPDKL